MKGICEAHGERIVEGSLIFNRKAAEAELPKLRFYLMRHFPDIEDPAKPAVHELAISNVSNFKVGDIWAGDADLKFFDSTAEEIAALKPIQIQGGFYHSLGLTINGGKVIHKYL
jgi:acetoacetate decarboxylase